MRALLHSLSLNTSALLLSVLVLHGDLLALPTINTPAPEISIVFRGNWKNTLKPCQIENRSPDQMPWRVDANGHYPGWYSAIDVKYGTRAYLFCEKNLPLVLAGWQHTIRFYRLSNGGLSLCEEGGPLGTTWPYRSKDETIIVYPLRASGSIDLLLTGDMIFRFSQDQAWLRENIKYLQNAARWLEDWIDDQGMLADDG